MRRKTLKITQDVEWMDSRAENEPGSVAGCLMGDASQSTWLLVRMSEVEFKCVVLFSWITVG